MLKYKKKDAKEWIKHNLTGDIPTLFTCFTEDGEVDYQAMRHNFRHILRFGTEGYAVNAYLGEHEALTKEEKKKILELTIEEAQRNKVLAITSVIGCLPDVMERIKHAEDLGADAVWLAGPPGIYVSEEGNYQWYKYIADKVNIGLAVFCKEISPWTVARLAAECPNIVSKKTAPPHEVPELLQALKTYKTEITLFMPFHSAFPCVLAGVVPPKLASFVNADRYIYNSITDQPATRCWEAAKKGDLKKAAELFYGEPLNIRRLWINNTFRGGDAHNSYADSIGVFQDLPLYKYWHELVGFKGGVHCRLPHIPPSEEAKQQIKKDVIKLGYIKK